VKIAIIRKSPCKLGQHQGRCSRKTIGGPRAKARLAFGHPPIGRLSSFALIHLTGSAHAPRIKCVRADCDSRHEKKIKRHFLTMPAILAAQQPAVRSGNKIMFQLKFNLFLVFMVVTGMFLGCATAHKDKISESNTTDCSLQVQNSVSLTAIRYISIINAIRDENTKGAVEDMDWWVDQAILELSFLEEKYPDKNLPEVTVGGSESTIKFKRLYREIARYRDAHPRIHTVPLNEEQSKAISSFVKKHK